MDSNKILDPLIHSGGLLVVKHPSPDKLLSFDYSLFISSYVFFIINLHKNRPLFLCFVLQTISCNRFKIISACAPNGTLLINVLDHVWHHSLDTMHISSTPITTTITREVVQHAAQSLWFLIGCTIRITNTNITRLHTDTNIICLNLRNRAWLNKLTNNMVKDIKLKVAAVLTEYNQPHLKVHNDHLLLQC